MSIGMGESGAVRWTGVNREDVHEFLRVRDARSGWHTDQTTGELYLVVGVENAEIVVGRGATITYDAETGQWSVND